MPGLAPWAILISSCSAFTRNCGVTPNRPLATCAHGRRFLTHPNVSEPGAMIGRCLAWTQQRHPLRRSQELKRWRLRACHSSTHLLDAGGRHVAGLEAHEVGERGRLALLVHVSQALPARGVLPTLPAVALACCHRDTQHLSGTLYTLLRLSKPNLACGMAQRVWT